MHGITLGFGITLIGESVDYSIYFLVQSRQAQGGAARSWQQLWWPTIRLGMLTSVCGFASLLPSGFPGLKQLGLYSISGLIAAALVTRYVLPALVPADFAIRDVTPLGLRVGRAVARAQRLGGAAHIAMRRSSGDVGLGRAVSRSSIPLESRAVGLESHIDRGTELRREIACRPGRRGRPRSGDRLRTGLGIDPARRRTCRARAAVIGG